MDNAPAWQASWEPVRAGLPIFAPLADSGLRICGPDGSSSFGSGALDFEPLKQIATYAKKQSNPGNPS